MAHHFQYRFRSLNPGAKIRNRGAALVIVLAVIVLVTALLVGFLLRAGADRSSTSSYAASVTTRQLADMAVNLVQAQINDATLQTGSFAWASQPGAVRVYDNGGNLTMIYRLYSSGTSMTTTLTSDLVNDLPPANWSSSPAMWVDLNAPAAVAGEQDSTGSPLLEYPILDPRDPSNPGTSANPNILSGTKMPGFFLGNTNGISTGVIPGATTVPLGSGSNPNPAPMPVTWMYVLKDGSIVPPTAGASGNLVTIPTATAANPIVGRVAFWTDDDTCKVNINTAGGSFSLRPDPSQAGYPNSPLAVSPAPWDTPRFYIWDELRLFSQNQPVHYEYQRYPGHPATTDLYSILSGLGMSMANYPPNGNSFSPTYTGSGRMAAPPALGSGSTSGFYNFFPRYGDAYSSQAGLANTSLEFTATPVATQGSRLYDSVGELLYAATVSSTNSAQRQVNQGDPSNSATLVSRQQLETGKFFLTARSRAPEITLFGTPRISMWPINSAYGTTSPGPIVSNTTSLASPYDKLIAFCTTTSGSAGAFHEYYIQRHDPTSPTADYDGANFFGNPGTASSGGASGISRNQQLFGYLQNLTSTAIPGFGGTFSSKYGPAERDQILTEMIDYIRCTDEIDHSIATAASTSSCFTTNAQVVPLEITTSNAACQGLGRMFTISEVGLLLICTADGNSTVSGSYVPPISVSGTLISPVAGSANDYRYVSNLPVSQYLLTGTVKTGLNNYLLEADPNYSTYFGTGFSITGATVPAAFQAACPPNGTSTFPRDNSTSGTAVPFPANPTLAATYGGALTPLAQKQKRIQAMLVIELQAPMEGYDLIGPSMGIKITGLNQITINGQQPFQNSDGLVTGGLNTTGARYGGYQSYQFFLTTSQTLNARRNGWSGVMSSGTVADLCPPWPSPSAPTLTGTDYRFISNPFTVSTDSSGNGTLAISTSGSIKAELQVTPRYNAAGTTAYSGTVPLTFQTFNLTFPNTTTPLPDLMQYGLADKWRNGTSGAQKVNLTAAADWWSFDNRIAWMTGSPTYTNGNSPSLSSNGNVVSFGCLIRSDPPVASGTWTYMSANWIQPPLYKDPFGNAPSTQPNSDVVRTLIAQDGDVRLVMAKSTVNADGKTDMLPTAGYSSPTVKLADSFTSNVLQGVMPGADLAGSLVPGIGPSGSNSYSYAATFAPKVPSTSPPQSNWDWDTGQVDAIDGAYTNKPDQGAYIGSAGSSDPYYNNGQNQNSANAQVYSYFTANRIINSPVMFGSLPTGVLENISWRTLQFRPIQTISDSGTTYNHNIRAATSGTYTLSGPPDHLLLDLFTMPVVEPYAISEPFSTAGKINMNYQIMPFTYITRDTGVRAVLGSELIPRVPLAAGVRISAGQEVPYYKNWFAPGAPSSTTYGGVTMARLPLNLDEYNGTLRQFQDKFAAGNIFKSSSEICDQYLVPKPYTWAGLPTPGFDLSWYGNDFALVGDNARERPYGDIYPRLTTKSNTYTVHYKVQAIQNPSSDPTQWNENTGVIKGEYRGSTSVERYLDPTDTNIPDYGDGTDPTLKASIENYYKWRIIANTAFAP